jgi:hypothetical protein
MLERLKYVGKVEICWRILKYVGICWEKIEKC